MFSFSLHLPSSATRVTRQDEQQRGCVQRVERDRIQGGPCGRGIDDVDIEQKLRFSRWNYTVVVLVTLCQQNLVHDHMEPPVQQVVFGRRPSGRLLPESEELDDRGP